MDRPEHLLDPDGVFWTYAHTACEEPSCEIEVCTTRSASGLMGHGHGECHLRGVVELDDAPDHCLVAAACRHLRAIRAPFEEGLLETSIALVAVKRETDRLTAGCELN